MPRRPLLVELRDPWGPLLGAVMGGLTWATGVPVLAAVGVGAAVYAVKALTGALLDGGGAEPALSRPAGSSPAGTWLARAEAALDDLREQQRDCLPGSLTGLAAERAAMQAGLVVDSARRLAAQLVAVEAALRRADSPGLDLEAGDLRARSGEGATDSSLQAVQDRLAVRDRLRTAHAQLVTRLQAAALGLEGLSARVAELVALAADTGAVDPSSRDLSDLTTEVEGLRQGLVESERSTRGVLDGE